MITPRHAAQKQEEKSFFSSIQSRRSLPQVPSLSHPLLDDVADGHSIGVALSTGGAIGATAPSLRYLKEPGEHDDADDSRTRRTSLKNRVVAKKFMGRWLPALLCVAMAAVVTPFVVRYGKSFMRHGPPPRSHLTTVIHDMLSDSMYDTGVALRGSGTYPEFVYAHPVTPRVGDVLGSDHGEIADKANGDHSRERGSMHFAHVQGGTDGVARAMTSLLHDQCYDARGRGIFLDVGSQYGYYSLLAASHGCRVLAVDVECWKHDFLEFPRRLNGLTEQVEPRVDLLVCKRLPCRGYYVRRFRALSRRCSRDCLVLRSRRVSTLHTSRGARPSHVAMDAATIAFAYDLCGEHRHRQLPTRQRDAVRATLRSDGGDADDNDHRRRRRHSECVHWTESTKFRSPDSNAVAPSSSVVPVAMHKPPACERRARVDHGWRPFEDMIKVLGLIEDEGNS